MDPAAAVAASICWLARWRGVGAKFAKAATVRHPSRCAWCDYPPGYLVTMVEEFNDADLVYDGNGVRFDSHGQPLHRVGGRFHALPRERQRALVTAAQYEGVEVAS
jgi:hypothetical protein